MAPVVPVPTGLCGSCTHQRLVRTGRGSQFSLCELHKTAPAYPKYPRLPVLACDGFTAADRAPGAPAAWPGRPG